MELSFSVNELRVRLEKKALEPLIRRAIVLRRQSKE
jgi:hypothetical protein